MKLTAAAAAASTHRPPAALRSHRPDWSGAGRDSGSIYRADGQLLVNQHTYGIPAAQAPVFYLCGTDGGEMAALYLGSFERVWAGAAPLA